MKKILFITTILTFMAMQASADIIGVSEVSATGSSMGTLADGEHLY